MLGSVSARLCQDTHSHRSETAPPTRSRYGIPFIQTWELIFIIVESTRHQQSKGRFVWLAISGFSSEPAGFSVSGLWKGRSITGKRAQKRQFTSWHLGCKVWGDQKQAGHKLQSYDLIDITHPLVLITKLLVYPNNFIAFWTCQHSDPLMALALSWYNDLSIPSWASE